MTQSNTPDNRPRPQLNRAAVQQRTEGTPLIDRNMFAQYACAFQSIRFNMGKKNNPHYLLTGKILGIMPVDPSSDISEADAAKAADVALAKYPVGSSVAFFFPTGRQGTPTDPGKPERDDALLASAVRAVHGILRGQKFDAEKGLDDLIALGKVDDDRRPFGFSREPSPKEKEIKDPTNGEVLRVVRIMYDHDVFFTITA